MNEVKYVSVDEIDDAENMDEDELIELVYKLTGDKAMKAEFDEWSIRYEVEDEDNINAVPAGWNEDYLRTLGMSMRDFL